MGCGCWDGPAGSVQARWSIAWLCKGAQALLCPAERKRREALVWGRSCSSSLL